MMSIPGGTFQMGSPEDELDRYGDESPQHEVTVQPFFMGRYAVTQAQWRVVAGYPQIDREFDPDPASFKGDNRPVEQVDWDDAQEFCQRLSAKTGKRYRLASEAEWEYACRAGTVTPFHFGETIDAEIANYDAKTEDETWKPVYGEGRKGEYREQTVDVGSLPANLWGLHETHGNVWEWCEDDWHDGYKDAPTEGRAWTEENRTETRKLLRGGSWYAIPRGCRSAVRCINLRDVRVGLIGFRVVCVPPRAL
ncbi:MAG: formylglycine-generating enzyme family protein [Coleofasciculaceae cyanobacterium RL_1_1]|nr:formylglycine-generating enzyme family protein [Coleofasciculaceae cyanobacterium RL_1_1]